MEGDQYFTVYKQKSNPKCYDIHDLANGTRETWLNGELRKTYRVLCETFPK